MSLLETNLSSPRFLVDRSDSGLVHEILYACSPLSRYNALAEEGGTEGLYLQLVNQSNFRGS